MKQYINRITVLLLLFCLSSVFGQTTNQTFCFTEPTSENEALYNSRIGTTSVKNSYCLKIYIHVIRRSNGSGGQSVLDVNEALTFLDTDYNTHGIYFQWNNSIDYIDSDTFYNNPEILSNPADLNSELLIFNQNNHTDGIDIYLFDDDNSINGGKSNGVGNSSEFYVSGRHPYPPFQSLVKSSVISHEMGHVFFLYHTHHGCETGNWEATNGSNGDFAGDFVSDTPSDPHMAFNVNVNDCEWNYVNSTQCNPPEPISNYNPDEQLIMAYTHPGCMSYFSEGQGQRMRNAIATLPHLINAVDNCINICDLNAPTTLTTTNISNNKADVSWNNVTNNNGYQLQYKLINEFLWNTNNLAASINTQTINNLDHTSTYQWRVRTKCNNGLFSDWSSIKPFTTLEGCMENESFTNTVSTTELIEVSNTITSYSTINPGADVTYSAGNKIVLKADNNFNFHAKADSKFLAKIEGCANSNTRITNNGIIKEPTLEDSEYIKETKIADKTSTLKLYPNPVESELTIISTKFKLSQFEVYNIEGKLLINNFINNNKHTINVQNLARGLYILKVTLENNEVIHKKIIKK